jgi:dynactin complex subunit
MDTFLDHQQYLASMQEATEFEKRLHNLIFSEISQIAGKKIDFETKSAAASRIYQVINRHIYIQTNDANQLDEVIDRLHTENERLRAELKALQHARA